MPFFGHTTYRNIGRLLKYQTREKFRSTSKHLLKKPILPLIKKRIYSEDDLEKLRGQRSSCEQRRLIRRLIWVFTSRIGLIVQKVFSKFSWFLSIKLVSFPCSLRRLIWIYTVCIGLSVPIFRFFKFLIRGSFVCISDEKRLYKVSLFFSRSGFPPRFHVTLPLRARGFFMGQGKCCFMTVAFSWYFNNYNILNI